MKKKKSKKAAILATTLITLVIAISIAIPMNSNKNKTTPIQIVEENNGLPKVENFENFYNIIKNAKSKNEIYKGTATITDNVNTTDESISKKSESNADYSTTNVQVEGVDEADIVKTDGDYIYYISSKKVVIVNVKDSLNLKIESEIEYENENFYPNELYIYENKLVVIGENNNSDYKELIAIETIYPTGKTTTAKVYNIENKKKPQQEREVNVSGSYLSSRMIDDNIYFITNKYLYSYLIIDKELNEIDENEFKPMYKDTAVSEEEKYIDYSDIYYFPESEDTSYLTVVGFEINDNKEANIETYLGAGTDIYSSQNNLYITRVKYEYKDTKTNGYYNNFDVNTYIYKFELEDSKATYINAGSVPGEVLNQFSMDEKDGYFRIATTDYSNWNSETNTNNLYVLNENLEIVGKVEDLAKGEKIYSVRFMGNRAYMVTFVETDPLFVIDLSEPTNPIVLGELKIPGYSKYLHPYDENHIIGFGEKTKTNENGGVVTDGMKMALFDVTNPNKPQELYSVDIGDQGTYSELLYNHKTLLFSKEKNIIAFPITIKEEEEDTTKLKFQGAIVYGLDLENGFTLKGKIAHQQIENEYIDYDYQKEVERIIYINDNLYTLSESLIKATNMNTMEEITNIEIK